MIISLTTKDIGKLLQDEKLQIGGITLKIANEIGIIEDIKPKKVKTYVVSYNYIKLTQEEYDNLKNDFCKIDIDKVIEGVETYVEMNANKNKYKNWYLVIRNAINGRWKLFDKNNNPINYGTYGSPNTSSNKVKKPVPNWYDEYVISLEQLANENASVEDDTSLEELKEFFGGKK